MANYGVVEVAVVVEVVVALAKVATVTVREVLPVFPAASVAE